MGRVQYEILWWIDNLRPHEWVMLLVGVIVVGAYVCGGWATVPALKGCCQSRSE